MSVGPHSCRTARQLYASSAKELQVRECEKRRVSDVAQNRAGITCCDLSPDTCLRVRPSDSRILAAEFLDHHLQTADSTLPRLTLTARVHGLAPTFGGSAEAVNLYGMSRPEAGRPRCTSMVDSRTGLSLVVGPQAQRGVMAVYGLCSPPWA